MLKQKENLSGGPFRATRLWDEAVRLFTHGIPRKRHRFHMRLYEDTFTGSEALKWFYLALEMNPHFSAVITQDKTHQLLNKFFEEGVFVKVRDSGRDGAEHFKLHGLYQLNQIKPQYSARTPLSTKYMSNSNQRSENWIRRSLHKESLSEVCDMHVDKNILSKNRVEVNPSIKPVTTNDPPVKPLLRSPQTCVIHDKPCACKPWRPERVVQHPVHQRKMYEQKLSLSPHVDNIWREVFSRRLQTLLPDIDVNGLLWPCAMIRCQWLEQNCAQEDSSPLKLPPWVKASTNRLLQALSDRNLNRSVVNLDIEADVSALEAYFGSLQAPLIPADLCALFLRVFLHLEMAASPSVDEDTHSNESDRISVLSDVSSESSCFEEHNPSLPPNTCFETAFTSASPVTRIVPQCSFDTLHLRPASACTLTKRNMSAPKLLESSSESKEASSVFKKSAFSQSTLTGLSDNIKFSTLSSIEGQNKPMVKVNSLGGSLQRNLSPIMSQNHQSLAGAGSSKGHHNCGQLKVIDKTPPNYRSGVAQRKPLEKHSRSHSGGYVNLGLQDSFDGPDFKNGELDLEAAMESLNKLILCSQPPASNKDSQRHVRSASLSDHQDERAIGTSEMRRSQSCWSQDLVNATASSNRTALSSSTLSLKSYSSPWCAGGSRVNSCSSLKAGCEWGWDWGSEVEKTGVAVFHLLMLLLPPQSRRQLKLLLKLMGLLPYQCPYTTIKVLEMFSSSIVPCGDENVITRFLGFMVRHHQEIFLPPEDFSSEVDGYQRRRSKSKERAAVTFCERVSLLQFEEQKLTTSQKALAELLDQIVADGKINPKEKAKKLKMFKESYPHIYSMKFPNAENVSQKSRHRSILQLARLRSLRV